MASENRRNIESIHLGHSTLLIGTHGLLHGALLHGILSHRAHLLLEGKLLLCIHASCHVLRSSLAWIWDHAERGTILGIELARLWNLRTRPDRTVYLLHWHL